MIWFHGRSPKITSPSKNSHSVRKIVRLVKINPWTIRKHLQEHLAIEGVDVSLNTVSYILHEAELNVDDALGIDRSELDFHRAGVTHI